MSTETSIGDSIKKIRWELRISQQALADEIGCTQTAISAWEIGDREPSYRNIKKLDAFAKKHKLKVNLI